MSSPARPSGEPDASEVKWYSLPAREAVQRLETDVSRGLPAAEAATRLELYGPNAVVSSGGSGVLDRILNQFRDVLIWLLLIAAATSGFVLDAWIDAAAIAAIVVLNAVIGYAQEAKASSALEELKRMEAPDADVLRDGSLVSVPTRDLVPGDILVLEAGQVVPADARVVEATRLTTDESALTGESLPVSKSTDPSRADAKVADRTSMVHAGTSVVTGRGLGVVTATGGTTEMGRIASLFVDGSPKTPLQVELSRIGKRLALLAIVAALAVFVAGLARSYPVESMALLAVALAVAAIPEGLPAVVTVSLAGGLQRMAHRNAVVRRLPAVEALGAVDVICTDKTGTLTAPSLEVAEVVLSDGMRSHGPGLSDNPAMRWLSAAAYLCNDAHRTPTGWGGDPTDVALRLAVSGWLPGDRVEDIEGALARVDEVPFDERRKRMSTVHRSESGLVMLVKGAPEVLLRRSSFLYIDGDRVPMRDEDRAQSLSRAERLASRGMRTLAFAVRDLDGDYDDAADQERDLVFVGIAGLRESIRPEVPSAVAAAASAGVRTVMVTGDHATTARAVADSVGLSRGEVMEGHVLSAMSSQELRESIDEYRVFARVDPADKVKIVEAWQAKGAKVAMTGDGVNDAPALHRADIGVAMGSGTDVARESAAMVLTDDNYATIVAAIAEGRRLFANLRNVVHYLLSANASEVIYVLMAFLVFGSFGVPITAVQLLWINLVSDSMPAIALGMDRPSRDLMKDRPGTGRDVLGGRNMLILLTQGALLALAAASAQLVGTHLLDLDTVTVRTMVFSTLVFAQLVHALSVRVAWASAGDGARRPGPLLMASVSVSILLHLIVVYSPLGQQIFGTVALALAPMAWVIAATIAATLVIRAFNRLLHSRDLRA